MKTCPECGEALGEDGLCEICLMAGGLAAVGRTTAATVADPALSGNAASLEYDHFGPYEIIRVLGEGGMGTVYLARQTSPIQRDVALKVVKPGMDTSQILGRFNYERQTLALMDHPNIARVFDASATEKGRPYFVMEYIDGEPITNYCDRKRMTTRERLELFLPVCRALQHAHQKGIIHRDIKPSNVMVTEVDGIATPKVIDFGIAKATGQWNFEQTAFTKFGQLVGTPEYMSPEAADVVNNDVDTSSDVYSLGVLLYELLIGAVPFDAKTLRKAGLAELMRIIREDEAPPMTAKLTQMGVSGVEVAERRRTDLLGLKRAVQGDLNWIVTKSVEKTRARRYPSAAEMLADIERHLSDRPVKASPPTKLYLTAKFVRRNRGLVIGSGAVAAAILIGLATTIWQARAAERGRADAMRQKGATERALTLAETRRIEAESQREKAEQAARRAQEQEQRATRSETAAQTNLSEARGLANSILFDLNEKVKDLGGSMPAQEAMVRLGTQSLRRTAKGDPMLGSAYFQLAELQGPGGLWDVGGAREHYRLSIQLLEEKWNQGRDRDVGRQLALAYSRLGVVSDEEKPQAAAQQRADTLLAGLIAKSPNDLALLRAGAEIQLAKDEPAKALDFLSRTPRESLADRVLLAAAQQGMAWKLREEDSEKALDWSLKAVHAMDAVVNETPQNATFRMQQADSLRVSSILLVDLNRYDEAFANARKAVEIGQDLAAMDRNQSNYQWLVAQAELALGKLHAANSEREKAQALFDRASKRMASQVARYPKVAYLAVKYAEVMLQVGGSDFAAADHAAAAGRDSEVLEALGKAELANPGNRLVQRWKVNTSLQLSRALAARGDVPAAMKVANEAVTVAERLQKDPEVEDRFALALAHFTRALSLADLNRLADAIVETQRVVAETDLLRRESRSEDVTGLWFDANKLAASLNAQYQDYRAALRAANTVLPLAEAEYALKPKSLLAATRLWNVLFELRRSHYLLVETESGLAAARKALEIGKRYRREHPSDARAIGLTRGSYVNLTADLLGNGNRAEGLRVAREGWQFIEECYGTLRSADGRMQTATAALFFVGVFVQSDLPEDAFVFGQKAVGWLQALVREDPENRAKRKPLETAYVTTAQAAADLGNMRAAVALRTKALELQRQKPENTAAYWIDVGTSEGVVGCYSDRLEPGAGREGYRRAIEALERARALAERSDQADARNLAALRDAYRSQQGLAIGYDYAGDLEAVDRWSETALHSIERLAAATQGGGLFRREVELMRGRAVRARSRLRGASADFRPLFGGTGVTPERIDEAMVAGLIQDVEIMTNLGYDPKARVVEAERAVEISRGLVRKDANIARRILLAQSLQLLAQTLALRARIVPAGRDTDLQRGLASARESLELYSALEQGKALPETNQTNFRDAKRTLLNLEARLAIEIVNSPARYPGASTNSTPSKPSKQNLMPR